MKVLWLTNIPSPYRVNFFNELGKYCELTVLFEKRISSERDKSWENHNFLHFKGIIMNGKSIGVDTAFCPMVLKYLKKSQYKAIFVTNYSTPTGMLAIYYLKKQKIPFIMEVDGGFPKSGKGLKEIIKKKLISSASFWFSSSNITDMYLEMYGAQKSKIIRYPFTSIFKRDIKTKRISGKEKTKLKKFLKIPEEKVILTIGQFIYRKGFDILLEAAVDLDKNVGIYIVGGEASKEFLKFKMDNKLENVHFVGFKTGNELEAYYQVADIFVLPTREDIWGLVINEAMAYGLPIITTDKCIAGLELITDNENGYLVPANNVKALRERIDFILLNDPLRNNMGLENLDKIKNYDIEHMVQTHKDFILSLKTKS